MKSITLIGIIFLAIAGILFYFIPNFSAIQLFQPMTLMGILAGIGIGLIFGGLVGYASKGSAVRQEQKRREIDQLRKEKEALEKQAAEHARLQNPDLQAPQEEKSRKFFF